MKFSAVIFDLDGTLLDTIEDLADSMNFVLQHFGHPPHKVEVYKYFVGDGMEALVRRALPEEFREEGIVHQALAMMQEVYNQRQTVKTAPYHGVSEMLDVLTAKSLPLAILSNKPDALTKQIVRELLPKWEFVAVEGAKAFLPKKPDPAGALALIKLLKIPPGEILYLGDTGIDMRTANAAGMYAVGALWGFRKAEELIENGAQNLVDHPLAVVEMIQGQSK